MGLYGRNSVLDKGAPRVVADLLQWYARGKQNRISRGYFGALIRIIILLFTVPFAIACMTGYQWVVSLKYKISYTSQIFILFI